MKKLLHIQRSDRPHWVGDGFPVRSIFSYRDLDQEISPFLLMDYAGPTSFAPSTHRRGVGGHPHRGFETVTIVYSGEVEHRDSTGAGGIIGPGDVQWMTAASGLIHEEFHGPNFSKNGGDFEMIQLWVNLPKEFKMTKPRYQGLEDNIIPRIGSVRVIAGEYLGQKGAANTYSPVNLWDIQLKANESLVLTVPDGHTSSLFVLRGEVETDGQKLESSEMGLFERNGTTITLKANVDSKILYLGGEPINEPIVGYGPFVMNTQKEIGEAFADYESGKMGRMP